MTAQQQTFFPGSEGKQSLPPQNVPFGILFKLVILKIQRLKKILLPPLYLPKGIQAEKPA